MPVGPRHCGQSAAAKGSAQNKRRSLSTFLSRGAFKWVQAACLHASIYIAYSGSLIKNHKKK
jgi:hypothetical protein